MRVGLFWPRAMPLESECGGETLPLEESAMRSSLFCTIGIIGLAISFAVLPASRASASQAHRAGRAVGQTIIGMVTDALGRPLAGAGLELQNSAGKVVAHAKSDAQGHFTFARIA